MSFIEQIEEDIDLIQEQWIQIDNHLNKREYAFNYWILSRIYDLDFELIPDLITEYNDKSIDCYVHYEDSKELYIIQNKFYDESSVLNRSSITDFLNTPLVCLNQNNYKKSKELQRIFNEAKASPDYKIFFHFFITNNRKSIDINNLINAFNNQPPVRLGQLIRANIFYLDDIKKIYFGESYNNQISFKYTLTTKVAKNILKILPVDYDMPKMTKACYVLTQVNQLHLMNIGAKLKHYPLFDENIRDYLGKSTINKGIIQTLKNPNDRTNFFYYNNGVTIICDSIANTNRSNEIELIKPQIINGCQTVNSITEVLSDYTDQEIKEQFNDVYVMVKVLEFEKTNKAFYGDIVKFTNKQNSINENAFGAKQSVFEKLQSEFFERGFLLIVKPSDKNKFYNEYANDSSLNSLLVKANKFSNKIGLNFTKVADLFIPLDKLLQVCLAFMKDGWFAYTKKDSVLKPTSDIYSEFSITISQVLLTENIIRLYLIYIKAEKKRSESDDKRSPIPYYLVGFFGYFISDKAKINIAIKDLFESKNDLFEALFQYLEKLTNGYRKNYFKIHDIEYNAMIKKPIDNKILDAQIEQLNDLVLKLLHPQLENFFADIA